MLKFLTKCKDGGPDSPVDAYVLFEIKNLCSVMLLKFNKGGREAFHTHAFDAFTWFLKGDLLEEDADGTTYKYSRSWAPKFTPKSKNHRVKAAKDSWCFTVRGRWQKLWTEYDKKSDTTTILSNGRVAECRLKGVYTVEVTSVE